MILDKKRIEELEQDSHRLFETEEALAKSSDDLDSLRLQLAEFQNEAVKKQERLEKLEKDSQIEITRLTESIEQISVSLKNKCQEIDQLRSDNNGIIDKLEMDKVEMSANYEIELCAKNKKYEGEIEKLKKSLELAQKEHNLKIDELQRAMNDKQNEIDQLKKQLEEVNGKIFIY